MSAFNLSIIFLLIILIFSIGGISTLFFIRFSKYFSGMKFKEFADDTTEGVENKVKQLLLIRIIELKDLLKGLE